MLSQSFTYWSAALLLLVFVAFGVWSWRGIAKYRARKPPRSGSYTKRRPRR